MAGHLVEVAQHLRSRGLVLDELRPQAQARDGRAQVVADRRQHAGSILHHAPDALAHAVQGARGRANLVRAPLGQGRGIPVEREARGGLGQSGSAAR